MALDTRSHAAHDAFALGQTHLAREALPDALACFEAARLARPADPAVYDALASTLIRMRRFTQALQCYQERCALDPGHADTHHNLGWTFEQLRQLDKAVLSYRQAVRLNPAADSAYNNLGNCLHALGRLPEAHAAFREAIRLAPGHAQYYRSFVQSKRLDIGDPCFIAMEQLMTRVDSLTPAQQVQLHFAYGQALADTGQHDRSFDHFHRANALHRPTVPYDETSMLALLGHLPSLVTADLFESMRGAGDPSAAPIFIVGMPRSGSSLIEQILASHPQVVGIGELPAFGQALATAMTGDGTRAGRLAIDRLSAASPLQFAALGADYLRVLREAAGDDAQALKITDKYLFNFMHVGLIHLALPNAKIVHSRRSPVETCLSIYSRLFNDVPFGYELGELGRYYRAYDALMAHWRRILPPGVMIEVQYEDLVDDFESEVRRLLAHCGLAWDTRCLAFHETRRQVITASAAQVREPLYRNALTRWRPQQAVLQPLLDALGPERDA